MPVRRARSALFHVAAGLVVGLFSVGSLAEDSAPKKVALLVGVNRYLKPGFKDLNFAEADVRAVGEELTKLGFDVTILLGSDSGEQQATLANIEAAARTMVAPLTKRDLALVMLSGHGQQLHPDPKADPAQLEFDKFQSFYCPVDAVVNRVETQFSLSHLVDDILAPNVGRKMLLVDACRDVPENRSRGRNAKGIEGRVVSLPEGTGVFFSCSAGQTSFENEELGHGLFTHCVLEGLRGAAARDGEIAWADLVAHVSRRMAQEDLAKLVPRNQLQVPIPAGAMPYTVLGRQFSKALQARLVPLIDEALSLSDAQDGYLQYLAAEVYSALNMKEPARALLHKGLGSWRRDDDGWWIKYIARELASLGYVDEGVSAARLEKSPVLTLVQIAESLPLSQRDRARKILQEAAQRADDPFWIEVVVKAQRVIEDFEGAAETSDRMLALIEDDVSLLLGDSGRRGKHAILAVAAAGKVNQAVELAGRIDDADDLNHAVAHVVERLSELGDFEAARRFAALIPEGRSARRDRVTIAVARYRAGEHAVAKKLIREERDRLNADERRSDDVAFIVAFANIGLPDEAAEIARDAGARGEVLALVLSNQFPDSETRWQFLEQMTFRSDSNRQRALHQLAMLAQELQRQDQAIEMLSEFPDDLCRLELIAERFHARGDPEQTLETLQQMLRIATRQSNPYQELDMTAQCASRLGVAEIALSAVDRMKESNRGEALNRVTTSLARAGYDDEAVSIVRTHIKRSDRPKALLEVAQAIARRENK